MTNSYDEFLRFKAFKGLVDRGLPQTQAYLDRMDYELGIVSKMGFSTYFLIVADLCRFMRERGILHNVRGSGCGSVVVWSIGITHKWLDPIALKIPFERFLNPARVTNPDLDIDIDDTRRHEVVQYTIEKYGADKVSHIVTFGTLGAKAAVQDVARALKDEIGENYHEVANRISGAIPTGMDLDEAIKDSEFIREQRSLYPRLFDFVSKVEGKIRHASIHAAGIIITPEPLQNYAPAYWDGQPDKREGSDHEPTIQWDMYDCEARGLLKMDYLGLKTLRVIGQTVEAINVIKQWFLNDPVMLDPYLEEIPKDCDKTWKMLAAGQLSGIFQVEKQFVRNFAKRMNLGRKDLWQLPILISIIRPGMMDAGTTEVYLKRASGIEPATPLHPLLAETLKESFGLACFQEDVMSICKDMAGMTLSEADELRRGIGKKKPEVVAKMKIVFIEGALKMGSDREQAEYVWSQLETFARYGFCFTGDTLVETTHGPVKIEDIRPGDYVLSMNNRGVQIPVLVSKWFDNGFRECFRYHFDDDSFVECTSGHKFLTDNGMVSIQEVADNHLDVLGVPSFNLVLDGPQVVRRRVVYIESIGERHVYDFEVDHSDHRYLLGNGICVSNCRGHAAAYGYVTAYQTAWLKANWSLPYMTFLINSESGTTSKDQGYNYKVAEYIEEARRLGLKIHPPCVKNSGYQCSMNWSEQSIRFGMQLIKGVGEKAIDWILRDTPESPNKAASFKDFLVRCFEHRQVPTMKFKTKKALRAAGVDPDAADAYLNANPGRDHRKEHPEFYTEGLEWKSYSMVGKGDLEALVDSGAFDIFDTDRSKLRTYLTRMADWTSKYHDQLCKVANGGKVRVTPEQIKATIDEIFVNETDADYLQRPLEDILEAERTATGCFLSQSPFVPYRIEIERHDWVHATAIVDGSYDDITVFPAVLKEFREITIKKGRNQGNAMAFLKWQGTGADVETVCFSDTWASIAANLATFQRGKVFLVQVRKDRDGVSSICTGVRRLSNMGYDPSKAIAM